MVYPCGYLCASIVMKTALSHYFYSSLKKSQGYTKNTACKNGHQGCFKHKVMFAALRVLVDDGTMKATEWSVSPELWNNVWPPSISGWFSVWVTKFCKYWMVIVGLKVFKWLKCSSVIQLKCKYSTHYTVIMHYIIFALLSSLVLLQPRSSDHFLN